MEKTSIITLDDDNKYVIVNKVVIKNINYYYLIDINNVKNVKFCREERVGETIILKEITDKEVITNVIRVFYIQEKRSLNWFWQKYINMLWYKSITKKGG